jgi:two-component system LytT family sensor kinase
MILEGYLVSLLVKLAAMAAVASVVARSNTFKSMLMRETRTLRQRLTLALWLAVVFAFGVAVRVARPHTYDAADLGLEGSLIAGLLGGYVTGLVSGILISLPTFFSSEWLTLPLLAGIGVLGGLLRDMAASPEDVWRFSPFPDLNIYRFFKEKQNHWRTGFQLIFFAAILCAEALRQGLGDLFNRPHLERVFCLTPPEPYHSSLAIAAIYGTTLFAVAIPLKIWNNTRNEKKLEEQERLLVEARLAALTSQINPHFLFNTLNSVSSLIRTDPNQARIMVVKLSKVLRRLLRKHEHFNPLRDELNFIEDYLSIEVIRFGDKLRFETDVAADTLDMLIPSMILQPLVENSIKHGLSSKVEGGTIRIHTHRGEARLHLLVEDDGVGISGEKLGTLLEHGGIGVSNVNERLKVVFGSEYRMWIESQPGNGTRVQIEIPELQTDLAAVS